MATAAAWVAGGERALSSRGAALQLMGTGSRARQSRARFHVVELIVSMLIVQGCNSCMLPGISYKVGLWLLVPGGGGDTGGSRTVAMHLEQTLTRPPPFQWPCTDPPRL